jgi:hypothetical protein
MPLSQFKNVVGNVATAAVLCYSYLGAPIMNSIDLYRVDAQINAPKEMNFDYYQLMNPEQALALEQIDIIHQFTSNILNNIKDLDPDFSKNVDENFWNLI